MFNLCLNVMRFIKFKRFSECLYCSIQSGTVDATSLKNEKQSFKEMRFALHSTELFIRAMWLSVQPSV
jgi:hypothetical protein